MGSPACKALGWQNASLRKFGNMQGSGLTNMQGTGLAKCKAEEIRQHARQWVDQHAKHWVGKMQGSGVGKDARQWNQTLYHSFVMILCMPVLSL